MNKTNQFSSASASITDLGRPLSHSSIVTREYGIPAMLATGVGTRHIKDGQTSPWMAAREQSN